MDFSTIKRIFIIAHKHALQGNEGSDKILKKNSDISATIQGATIAIKLEGYAYHNFFLTEVGSEIEDGAYSMAILFIQWSTLP